MKKIGFRNTLILSVSVLIMVCLLVSNIYSYKMLKDKTIESVDQVAIAAAASEAVKLQGWFANRARAVENLAKYYKPGLDAEQYVELAKYTNDISDLTAVLIALDDGRAFSTISSPAWVDGVAIVDKYDATTRDWYKLGKRANGKLDISKVYESASSGKKQVSIVKAIEGGVVMGIIEIGILEDTINAIKYPGAITGILDDSGVSLITNATDWPLGKTFAELGVPELDTQMNASKNNRFDFAFAGIEKVAYTHEIEMVSGKKWHLFIGVDKSVAYKAVDDALADKLITSTIMLLISIAVCIVVLRSLYSPVVLLKNLVLDLSKGNGDLTRRLPVSGNDDLAQISQGINTFIENLQGLMLKVSGTSGVVAGSAEQMDMLTNRSNHVLSEHRKETEQVVSALEEMSATSNDVANNTSAAAQNTTHTSEQVMNSKALMVEATYQVEQLVSEVETTSASIAQLGNDMTEITNVLTVIGEIADQTNLLALNAAIEAARAGEHGRGFAVVADEVRALASRTQASTSEIEATIEKLRVGVSKAISSMDKTKLSCQETSQKNTNIAADLEEISESIQDINAINIQNATAAEQQRAVANEMTENMHSINDMVEQLTCVGRDTAAEKDRLVEADSQLNAIVSQFKLR